MMKKLSPEQKKKRRKRTIIELSVFAVVLVVAYIYLFMGRKIPDKAPEIEKGTEGTKELIVYFTRSGVITAEGDVDAVTSASLTKQDGVTEKAARQLQEITGADLYQIRTKRYYKNSFGGTAATAWVEERLKLEPKLLGSPDDISSYDVIYVGFPVWWFNAPMAIGSFLDEYDLTGKKIVPFCTSQDNGIDVCMKYIEKHAGNGIVLNGYRVNNSSDEDILRWLENNGLR